MISEVVSTESVLDSQSSSVNHELCQDFWFAGVIRQCFCVSLHCKTINSCYLCACPCHDARQGWNSPEAGYPECFISTTLSSMVLPIYIIILDPDDDDDRAYGFVFAEQASSSGVLGGGGGGATGLLNEGGGSSRLAK